MARLPACRQARPDGQAEWTLPEWRKGKMNLRKFKIFHYGELLILGIALGFLFFGWNAAEQHLTSFYQTIEGQASTGLNALAILYASTIIGSFAGPIFARKFGLKFALFFGFLTYPLLVFGVVTRITPLIFALSAFMGIGCGISGVAQIDLIRILSSKNLRGELTGSINALRTVGGALGILSVSLLLKAFRIDQVYLVLGGIMIIGALILLLLKAPRESGPREEEKILSILRKTLAMLKEARLLLTIPLSTANGFLLGLILGAIPASITKSYGIEYVGLTMPLFHLALSFSGFYSGKISDKIGRFSILYYSITTGIIASLIVILTEGVAPIILAMLLAGFFSAANGVVISALFIDMFGRKVKEAQAANGVIGTIVGIVPAFILNKYLATTQLLYLAIFLCLLGGGFLKILEVKEKTLASF